jgi:hypothetical protein
MIISRHAFTYGHRRTKPCIFIKGVPQMALTKRNPALSKSKARAFLTIHYNRGGMIIYDMDWEEIVGYPFYHALTRKEFDSHKARLERRRRSA